MFPVENENSETQRGVQKIGCFPGWFEKSGTRFFSALPADRTGSGTLFGREALFRELTGDAGGDACSFFWGCAPGMDLIGMA